MATLRDYYLRLQEFERITPVELIAPWQGEVVDAIQKEFNTALQAGILRNVTVSIPVGTSNQSVGNKIADFAAARIDSQLHQFKIESCTGQGYPDRMLC